MNVTKWCFLVLAMLMIVGCGEGELDAESDASAEDAEVQNTLKIYPISRELRKQMARDLREFSNLPDGYPSYWGRAILHDGRVIERVIFAEVDGKERFEPAFDTWGMFAEEFEKQVEDDPFGEEMARAMRESLAEQAREMKEELAAGMISIKDVARVEIAEDALPASFAQQLGELGEFHHGVTIAVFKLRDGREFSELIPAYGCFAQPSGFELSDVVAIRSLVRGESRQANHAKQEINPKASLNFASDEEVKHCFFLRP